MKLPALALVPAVLFAVVSCSLSPGASPAESLSPSASPSPSATATIDPPVSSTEAPIQTQTAAITPAPTAADLPPRGYLQGDELPVEGWLGSYCWENTCSDIAAPPPVNSLPIVYSDPGLEFTLSDGASFNGWRATYKLDDSGEEGILGQGGQGFDPDAQPSPSPDAFDTVSVPVPAHDAMVSVQVFLPGGDISFYWHVFVVEIPPSAQLRVSGQGAPVEGTTGSWCYYDGCADKPAVPIENLVKIEMQPEAQLRFRLVTGDHFAFARANYAPRMDAMPHELGTAGVYVDPDTNATQGPLIDSFEFTGPPRGSWALEVTVWFADGIGTVPYEWHAVVE